MAEVILSKRLQALACMVTTGRRVVDVGCDHGFVSVYLVQRGICPHVLAMDVRTGPLSRAKEHIEAAGLTGYIETRLSDGLLAYQEGEAESLICAGMGGRLMMKILTESRDKARGLQELILQPQSEIPAFRRFLREEGYQLLDENIIWEDGKYYFLMKVRYGGEDSKMMQSQKSEADVEMSEEAHAADAKGRTHEMDQVLADKFGALLLKRRSPVLKQYLEDTLQNMHQIEASLARSEKERALERLKEVQQEIVDLERARDFVQMGEACIRLR